MAESIKQRIITDWKVKRDVVLTQGSLEAAGRDAAEAQIGVWRKRTMAGIGANGRPLKKLSKPWLRQKQRYLDGKVKHRKGKPKWLVWTEYKAQRAEQVGIFTGRTLLDFKYKDVRAVRHGTDLGIRWDPYVANTRRPGSRYTSADIVAKLRKDKRDIFGATATGKWRKDEEAAITKAITKRIAAATRGQIRVK